MTGHKDVDVAVPGLPGRGPANFAIPPVWPRRGSVGGANPAPDPKDGRAPHANHHQGRG